MFEPGGSLSQRLEPKGGGVTDCSLVGERKGRETAKSRVKNIETVSIVVGGDERVHLNGEAACHVGGKVGSHFFARRLLG